MLKSVVTRFRAYKLGQAGSSFSYFAEDHFTLGEAVVTDANRPQILAEMRICGKSAIDTLHITSWDQDHCSESGLKWILETLTPRKIEYPGYLPSTDCGKACLAMVREYQQRQRNNRPVKIQPVDPPYINGLKKTEGPGYTDIFYHPREFRECSNDNSIIKFFRRGSFSVLSLGDVEDPNIAAMLRRAKTLCREVDVMILAHHGADNGFTTKKFIRELNPSVAICTSDFDNKFGHPRQEIRDILREQSVDLFTTKNGDVIISSFGSHRVDYGVTNLCADSTKISSRHAFKAKKAHWLSMNADSVRNVLHPGKRGPR